MPLSKPQVKSGGQEQLDSDLVFIPRAGYGGGNSLMTLTILALSVLLFDTISDALADGGGGGRDVGGGGLWNRLLLRPELWRWATAPDRWDRLLAELSAEEAPVGREVLLPGPGLIGDYINSLLEIGLNMITVWMHG